MPVQLSAQARAPHWEDEQLIALNKELERATGLSFPGVSSAVRTYSRRTAKDGRTLCAVLLPSRRVEEMELWWAGFAAQAKGPGHCPGAFRFVARVEPSAGRDVRRARAFSPLPDLEVDLLAFIQ